MNESSPGELLTNSKTLRIVVGVTAVCAPLLHSITDLMEWFQKGYSTKQLLLNYLAFLPMSWLLLGLYAVHERKPNVAGLLGALLYGAAFTYFAFTTLFALMMEIPTYESLWQRLGATYTFHGALMVSGGILFGWACLRAAWLPKTFVVLFLAGNLVNLLLALLPGAPDILQIIGSAFRNFGLIGIGISILRKS